MKEVLRDYPASVVACKVIIRRMADSRNPVLVLKGANIAGFKKVADAMLAFGVV